MEPGFETSQFPSVVGGGLIGKRPIFREGVRERPDRGHPDGWSRFALAMVTG